MLFLGPVEKGVEMSIKPCFVVNSRGFVCLICRNRIYWHSSGHITGVQPPFLCFLDVWMFSLGLRVWLLLLIDQRIAPETTYYVLAGMLNLQGGHQPGKHGKVREFESG